MPRQITLRQIEAFKAVIESGTVRAAADVLNVSQPSMSRLIAYLEMDTGLTLFDRVKGRLIPTEHAMVLHDEVERIFAGVRQVENAVERLRRAEQVRLAIGVMVALSGSFIQRATTPFREANKNVHCSFQTHDSQKVLDLLVQRKIDVGLVGVGFSNPYVVLEPLMEHPLVCIMPLDHPLAARKVIEPPDLDGLPFVSFSPNVSTGRQLEQLFDSYRIRPRIDVTSNIAVTLCEFVAAGAGVSLVHPLVVSGMEHRIIIRRFVPEISDRFQLGRVADHRNGKLVDAYIEALREAAAAISASILSHSDWL